MDLDAVLRFKPDNVVGLKRKAEEDADMDHVASKRVAPETETENERLERLMDDAAEVENFDVQVLKRVTNTLHRAIKINNQLRSKFPDEPQKFMESEIDLDEAINNMAPLASAPDFYADFVSMKGIGMLTGLLSHENSDIALAVIGVLYDLTDVDESYEDSGVMNTLVDAFQKEQLLPVLVNNLSRLDETLKEDQDGVHKLLGVLENLVEIGTSLTGEIAKTTKVVEWLLERVLVREMDANKLYASEMLSIFVQDAENGIKVIMEHNGMDTILRSLSRYKKRDARAEEEKEMVENLFMCICTLLMQPANLDAFLQVEGVSLMMIMVKGKMNARCAALKVLDFALNNDQSGKLCEHLVDILGLKTLFPCFMKTPSPKYLKGCGTTAKQYEEHACSAVASLFEHLDKDGTNRDRLLNKFVENDFAKMDRLFELHSKYTEELARCDDAIKKETRQLMVEGEEVDEEKENDFYMKRLKSGLFTLHLVDTIIAYTLMANLPGANDRLEMLMHQSGLGYESVVRVLQDKLDNGGSDRHGTIAKFIESKAQPSAST